MTKVYLLAGLSLVLLVTAGGPFREKTHKRLHELNIPESDFVTVNLAGDTSVPLPMEKYPGLNKHVAFRLTPAHGDVVDIVIKNIAITDEYLDELEEHHNLAKQSDRKKGLATIVARAREYRDSGQGLDAFYRRVHGNSYKLINLRAHGKGADGSVDKTANIRATNKGNLHVYEKTPDEKVLHVFELDTKHGE